MDGVRPLPVPTLVIGMTNRLSLIDPALKRPGRFEVQIEVAAPSDKEQRSEIFKVHTKKMKERGRIERPEEYGDKVEGLAAGTEGFTGADIAGLCRNAASRALERAVEGCEGEEARLLKMCKVTWEDFEVCVEEVRIGKEGKEKKIGKY